MAINYVWLVPPVTTQRRVSMNEKLLYCKEYADNVQNIKSLVSYEGDTLEELEEDFHGDVDDYLAYLKNL